MGTHSLAVIFETTTTMMFVGILLLASLAQTWGLSYKIIVTTGSRNWAGTDAKVWVNIVGSKGTTGKMWLGKSSTNGNSFERGQKDEFTVDGIFVGRINSVVIGHDNSGRSAAWYLDSVSVQVGTCTTTLDVWRWLYRKRLSIHAYPTLETGNCDITHINFNNNGGGGERSKGSVCVRDFKKIGCFSRQWEKVEHLLVTDLDPTHKAFGKDMNWDDFELGLHSLACRCRAKAVEGKFKYFAIGFLGECVAGKDNTSLEEMFKVKGEKDAGGCVSGEWTQCDKNHEKECGGQADYDFFYEIL